MSIKFHEVIEKLHNLLVEKNPWVADVDKDPSIAPNVPFLSTVKPLTADDLKAFQQETICLLIDEGFYSAELPFDNLYPIKPINLLTHYRRQERVDDFVNALFS